MCWAFDNCPGSDNPEEHSHCSCCGEGIPTYQKDGEKQWACVPECEEARKERKTEQQLYGPVSWCCICGGLGNSNGKCWGCQ